LWLGNAAEHRQMNLLEEFRTHANSCRQTARLEKDPVARRDWESLAERWDRCAQVAENTMWLRPQTQITAESDQ
jgi:hypothetical protein